MTKQTDTPKLTMTQPNHPITCLCRECLEYWEQPVNAATTPEPPREEIVPAPACGYAALRENVERRLAEAQREINSHTLDTSKHVKAHWYGRAAALAVLLQDDEDRTKAPHIDQDQRPRAGRGASATPPASKLP